MSRIETIRSFMGAVIDEARINRVSLARMERKLDDANEKLGKLLKLLGERDAKHEGLRADHTAVATRVAALERRPPGVGR